MNKNRSSNEKQNNKRKPCVLLWLIIGTSIAFGIFGTIVSKMQEHEWSWEYPAIAYAFTEDAVAAVDTMVNNEILTEKYGDGEVVSEEALAETTNESVEDEQETDDTQKWTDSTDTENQNGTGNLKETGEILDSDTEEITTTEEELSEEELPEEELSEEELRILSDPSLNPGRMIRPTEFIEIEPWEAKSIYYDDGHLKPKTTIYPYIEVDGDYYEDALFIGDSRIEGLYDYGGLDNATFAFKNGLTVYKALDATLKIKCGEDKRTGTLEEALDSKDFNKIFIMLGVNELGSGSSKNYADSYAELVKYIREKKPNAVIEIMGIMYVTRVYSDSEKVFNNDNINCRNLRMVKALPEDDAIIYLDMNESVSGDEENALSAQYTKDALHLTAKYYYLWVDWLNAHGLQPEMFETRGYEGDKGDENKE